jgi:hypothetical protein
VEVAVVASERERARGVLTAVRALPPGALDAAIAAARGPDAEQLAAVRAALGASDPEAALVVALRHVSAADPAGAIPVPAVASHAARAAEEVAGLRSSLDDMLVGQRALAALGAAARGSIRDLDPALAAMLDDTLGVLDEDGPFAAVKAAVISIGGVQDLLADVDAGSPDPGALALRVGELRRQRDAITGASDALVRIPGLVAAARAYASRAGDLASEARLAVAQAALCDREPGSAARWTTAFELSTAAALLPLARACAARIEIAAAAEGTLEPILRTSAQIARLASQLGDIDAELAAVCDEALAWAWRDGGAARARRLVERAYELAGEDRKRGLSASLVEAQVVELLGDAASARALLREIMEYGPDIDGGAHIVGWAALHLGRLEGAMGHAFRAGQDLDLAQQVGDAAGDHALFALAIGARLDLAPDRAAAEGVLATAERAPRAVRDELRRQFDRRWCTIPPLAR